MALPKSLANFSFFSVYDRAIRRWIRGILDPVDNQISVIMASPQRAFASIDELHRRSASSGEAQQFEENLGKMPLPLVSVQRGSIEPRSGRMYPDRLHFRNLRFTDTSGRFSLTGRAPVPVWLEYQLDFWAKTQSSMSALVDRVLDVFDPFLSYGIVEVGEGWSPYPMAIRLSNFAETSDLEGGQDDDRIVRYTLSIRVEAWKFFNFEEGLTAQEFQFSEDPQEAIPGLEFSETFAFKNIYIQNERSVWHRIFLEEGGRMFFWPVNPSVLPKDVSDEEVPTQVSKLVVKRPIILGSGDEKHELRYQSKTGRISSRRVDARDEDSQENLVIHRNQNLLIPEGKRSLIYGELKLTHRGYPNIKATPILGRQ